MRASEVRAEARAYKDELVGHLRGAVPGATTDAGPRVPGRGGILGVGYGVKMVGGRSVRDLAVRVYVRAKRPLAELPDEQWIPAEVNGRPTDVIEVYDLAVRQRPVPCGVSIGHVDVSAGTLGCLVTRTDDDRHILSNNHVLADSNAASVGDPILEPGPIDGGDPDDPIARLAELVPVRFDGTPNRVDAAIGELLDPGDVRAEIAEIGAPLLPTIEPELYASVRKHGRTTGHTVGVVVDVAADVDVRFGAATATFHDQFAVVGVGGGFSDGGDSGALLVDAVRRHPVGLLFAGGGDTTFANPIDDVLDALDVAIVGEQAAVVG